MKLINGVVEDLAKQGQAAPPEARIRLERAQQRFASANAEADAEEAAQIDPDRAAILARQQGQIKEEEARIASDVKRSPWEALTQGGLALMDPEPGAGFTSALSSGLRTGLSAYTSAKADAIERRARLQKETNSTDLQRLDALTQARAVAVAAIRRGEEVDERTARMAKMTDDEAIAIATQPQRIEAARLAPQVIQAAISKDEASADAYRASADKDRRTDPNLRSTGGDGGPNQLPPGARAEVEGRLATAYQEQDEEFRKWVRAGRPRMSQEKPGTRKWEAAQSFTAAQQKVRNLRKILGQPEVAPASSAAPRPTGGGRILSSTPIK
jgi:hypothetical protein